MQLIDTVGLTDSPVPIRIYAKALGLSGYMVPGEERDLVLLALRATPPEPGDVTVYTGPSAASFWAAAPPSVRVYVVPGAAEVPMAGRFAEDAEGLLAWCLHRRGVSASEAKGLSAKAPTERHSKWATYAEALKDFQTYRMLADDWPIPGAGWEYLGDRPAAAQRPYRVVLVESAGALAHLGRMLEWARNTDSVIGLDVENDETDKGEAQLVGIGIAFVAALPAGAPDAEAVEPPGGEVAFYLDTRPESGESGGEGRRGLLDAILGLVRLNFVEREPPRFVAHNAKHDMQVLAHTFAPDAPVRLLRWLSARLAGDGLIAEYCLAHVDTYTGRPLPKDLKTLAERRFGVNMLHFGDMLDLSGAMKASDAPVKDIGPYCCADAYQGVQVERAAREELAQTPSLLRLYESLELPTVPLVAEMETLGMPLNAGLLDARKRQTAERVEVYRKYLEQEAERAGYQLATKRKMCPLHSHKKVDYGPCVHCDDRGRVEVKVPFNPNSRMQVEAVIQGTFRLPVFNTTDTGAVSNDEASLLRLREFTDNQDAKDWITFLVAWRKDSKVLGTYLVGLDERKRRDPWQSEDTWFVHSTFNQATTGEPDGGNAPESGRFSSKDPNLQNVPLNQRDLFDADVLT